MALGFEMAGFDVLAAVELDPVHLAVHERNFPLCEPVCQDVSDLTAADVYRAAAAGWRRRNPDGAVFVGIDCVFGGPSCQGFSVIGSRDPADQRNMLIHEFVRLVLDVRPRWFVLENVPGLASPAYREVLSKVFRDLRGHGYRVPEAWALNARDFGVPQERKRIFIVGARRDQRSPTQPLRTAGEITVADALDDLPKLGRFRRLFDSDRLELNAEQLAAIQSRQSPYVKRLNGIAVDPHDRSDRRKWDPATIRSVGLTAHGGDVVARFRRLKPGVRDEIGRLPKLDESRQSPTLRAGTGRDHGSFTSARPIHHRSPRVITVREAARLHGFPDWFAFHTTRWHGFRQVGNAVPPPLAHAVAATIVTASGVGLPRRRLAPLVFGSDELLKMSLIEAGAYYGIPVSMLPKNVRSAPNTATARRAA
jgi:DNA (cytosine-5)-methyltransferase 1